jgi:hypothetical protein
MLSYYGSFSSISFESSPLWQIESIADARTRSDFVCLRKVLFSSLAVHLLALATLEL